MLKNDRIKIEEFKEGQKITLLVYDDRIEIQPISFVSEKLGPAFVSKKSLAKNWESPEENRTWNNL